MRKGTNMEFSRVRIGNPPCTDVCCVLAVPRTLLPRTLPEEVAGGDLTVLVEGSHLSGGDAVDGRTAFRISRGIESFRGFLGRENWISFHSRRLGGRGVGVVWLRFEGVGTSENEQCWDE